MAGNAWSAFFYPDIRPGYGVTSQTWLGKYFPALKGTHLDTPVFFLDSGKAGAALRILKYLADGFGAGTGWELSIKGLPEYPAIMEKGVGGFLN